MLTSTGNIPDTNKTGSIDGNITKKEVIILNKLLFGPKIKFSGITSLNCGINEIISKKAGIGLNTIIMDFNVFKNIYLKDCLNKVWQTTARII